MGLFDFVASAGELLGFGGSDDADQAATDHLSADQAVADALAARVRENGLKIENLTVSFSNGVATVGGRVNDAVEREKVILVVGNNQGVAQVDDQIEMAPAPPVFYTVQSGDSLSRIAKRYYGDAMKYPEIFEANKPMLSHPDKIYPGQVLRIPPQD